MWKTCSGNSILYARLLFRPFQITVGAYSSSSFRSEMTIHLMEKFKSEIAPLRAALVESPVIVSGNKSRRELAPASMMHSQHIECCLESDDGADNPTRSPPRPRSSMHGDRMAGRRTHAIQLMAMGRTISMRRQRHSGPRSRGAPSPSPMPMRGSKRLGIN